MECGYNIDGEELILAIERAKKGWQCLNNRLNALQDERAIEQTIYELVANEKRYNYLLQCAKEKKVKNPRIILR